MSRRQIKILSYTFYMFNVIYLGAKKAKENDEKLHDVVWSSLAETSEDIRALSNWPYFIHFTKFNNFVSTF